MAYISSLASQETTMLTHMAAHHIFMNAPSQCHDKVNHVIDAQTLYQWASKYASEQDQRRALSGMIIAERRFLEESIDGKDVKSIIEGIAQACVWKNASGEQYDEECEALVGRLKRLMVQWLNRNACSITMKLYETVGDGQSVISAYCVLTYESTCVSEEYRSQNYSESCSMEHKNSAMTLIDYVMYNYRLASKHQM